MLSNIFGNCDHMEIEKQNALDGTTKEDKREPPLAANRDLRLCRRRQLFLFHRVYSNDPIQLIHGVDT